VSENTEHSSAKLTVLLRKAAESAEFRERLSNDPRNALEDALQITIDPDVDVHVHSSGRNEIHIVLPDPADVDALLAKSNERSDDPALEQATYLAGKALGLIPVIPAGAYDWRI
jgi:hypothetical protein